MMSEFLMQSIVLTGDHFEIVLQATYQATSFQDYRLLELDVTPQDLDHLIVTLRVFRDAAERAELVRIVFDGVVGETDRYVPVENVLRDASQAAGVLQIDLSVFWASRWRPLIGLVASGLSHRELFLRTGYEWNEIDAAVANFEDLN
jgi:hypothetical protein